MMPANAPLRTQCAQVKGGHFSLVAGNMLKLRGDNIGDAVDQPVHTVSAGGTHHGLVATSLIRHFGMSVGQRLDSPAPTVMGNGGGKSGLIATHLTKFCTGSVGTDMCQPAPTVTAGSHSPNTHGGAAGPLGIVAASIASTGSLGAEGADSVASLNDPTADALETMTDEEISGARRVAAFLRAYGVKFEGEFAMIEGFVIVDIGLRMLVPRELFRAQGFPDSYVIDRAWVVDPQNGRIEEVQLTKEQQIRMCGNSVCPPVQMALIRANVPELSILGRPHRRNLPRELAGIG
jgi:DNA (cytosine-5)-methyltransferase 1